MERRRERKGNGRKGEKKVKLRGKGKGKTKLLKNGKVGKEIKLVATLYTPENILYLRREIEHLLLTQSPS